MSNFSEIKWECLCSLEPCSLPPLSSCLVWKELWLICDHPCLTLQSIGLCLLVNLEVRWNVMWCAVLSDVISLSSRDFTAAHPDPQPDMECQVSLIQTSFSNFNQIISVREHLPGKKMFSFGHCPNYLSLPPIRATCTTFSAVKKEYIKCIF